MTKLIETTRGSVEAVVRGAQGPWVLYFHGGHESAAVAPVAELHAELGCRVLAISRPGYGRTRVGDLSPADFSLLADEVRRQLGLDRFRAVVGTSFGGPQAIAYAALYPDCVQSLILHSAAPSTEAYPDSDMQRLFGPIVFHPSIEGTTWAIIRALFRVAPEFALRRMLAALTTRDVNSVLNELSSSDRRAIAELFSKMRSGQGFNIDLHWAGTPYSADRRALQQRVACPTLITASHFDRGVAWKHAADFAATIPNSKLVTLDASSHLFWIGSARRGLVAGVEAFLASV